MKREVLIDPNHILREPAKTVESFDMALQNLIDDMVETMRSQNGVGLAAPQVGVSKKVIVCELESEENQAETKEALYEPFPLTIICNPEIKKVSHEKCKMVEGCLSFPGMELVIDRPKNITISGQDRYGEPIEIEAKKLFARVLQHETDHLNSTLLIDHLKEIKVVFFGSGDFGLKPLEFLIKDKQYDIAAVVTTPQVSRVRGKSSDNNRIKQRAKNAKLKILEIESLKESEVVKKIKELKADIGIVVDFGLIIPDEVIDLFKYKIVNIHPSLLPKYRGSSPIQSAILNGDKATGVSLMVINSEMDAGPILSQYKIKLKGEETTPILKEYLSDLGGTLLLDTLPYYISKELEPKEQRENKATYTKLISKEDGRVDEQSDPLEVERKIRALQPWPGVYTMVGDLRVGLMSAHLDSKKELIIDRVKPAGKNEMTYQDFRNGYKMELTFGKNIDNINAN